MYVIQIDTGWFNLAIHSTLLHIVKEDTKLINWLKDYFPMICVHEIPGTEKSIFKWKHKNRK